MAKVLKTEQAGAKTENQTQKEPHRAVTVMNRMHERWELRMTSLTYRFALFMAGFVLMVSVLTGYVQLLPFILVGIAEMAGISSAATLNSLDGMLWVLMSIGVLVPLIALFMAIVKAIWYRMILQRMSSTV